jgi:hypothetical protein
LKITLIKINSVFCKSYIYEGVHFLVLEVQKTKKGLLREKNMFSFYFGKVRQGEEPKMMRRRKTH